MNKDTSFRLLILVAVCLLGYIAWMNTREIVELELELDKLRGGLSSDGNAANPVPAAEKSMGTIPGGSFEDTLGG